MGNCLITKLKSVVNNDNLEKVGIGKLVFNVSEANSEIVHLLISNGIDVYFDKDVKVDETVISAGTRIPSKVDTTHISSTDAGTYTMTFTKYTMTYLWCSVESINTDINNISYSNLNALRLQPVNSLENFNLLNTITSLVELYVPNMNYAGNISNALKSLQNLNAISIPAPSAYTSLTGDIAVLQDKLNLRDINFRNQTGITGNISVLKDILPNISALDIINTGITGDFKYLALLPSTIQNYNFAKALQSTGIAGSIEDFVAVKRGHGETTGSMSFAYLGLNNITFQGVQISNPEYSSLSWTASTITFQGVEIQNSDVDTLS